MADQRARPVSRVRARGARRAGATAKRAGPRRWTGLRRARCAERKGAPTSGVCRSGKGCGTLVRGPLGMLLRYVRGCWAMRGSKPMRKRAGRAWERAEGEWRRRERVCGLNQGGVRKWAAGRERGSSWARVEVGWASWAEGWVWVSFLFLFLFFFKLTQTIYLNSNQI